jgi:DNA mismatch repair protein MutL
MEKINNRTVARQGMLVPYVFNVNAEESSFLEQKLGVLQEIGFDIEPFGVNSFRVSEIPVDLQNIQIDEFFKEILSNLDDLKAINLQNMLREKIATTACKHAIKGGWDLTKEEKDKLFERMEGNMGLKCPHGRPVCVKLTKTEIEKMFKRIV